MEPAMTFEQRLDAIQKADEERRAQDAREREEWKAEDRRHELERQQFDAEDAEAQRKAERIGFWLRVGAIACVVAWLGLLALAIYIRK